MATQVMNTRIKQKSDLAANWSANNPVLLLGEIGIESDTGKFKIGDGSSAWSDLVAHEVFTAAEKALLATITANAEPNVQSDWAEEDTSSDAYIKNKPNLAAVATSGKAEDVAFASDSFDATNVKDAILEVAAEAGAISYSVKKAASPEEGFSATYQLYSGETAVGDKINIPKDFLVKSGDVKTVETADTPVAGYKVGDKYLDFVVNSVDSEDGTNDTHIYILVQDLVDVYKNGNGIVIGADNVIAVKIDEASANGLSATESGLALAPASETNPGAMSAAAYKKLADVDENANNYVHPDTAGNKHIPAGGAEGQVLGYDSDGTAKWMDVPTDIATVDAPGVVKSIAGNVENGVSVAADGTMSVNSLNVKKLVQTEGDVLVLDGGTSSF